MSECQLPAWPAYPSEIFDVIQHFERDGVPTQTHCVVTWVVAGADGRQVTVCNGTMIYENNQSRGPVIYEPAQVLYPEKPGAMP